MKASSKWTLGLKEIASYKELFYFFAWRDIKVKYKQSILGFGWAILQPLIMVALFTFIFGKKLGIESESTIPYPIFVLSGLIFWFVFSSGLNSSGQSMVSNSSIIKKVYFPRLIIPLSAILVSVFDFLMSLTVLVGMVLYYHFTSGIDLSYGTLLVALPIGLILTVIATTGSGLLISALSVKFRDFKYVVPFTIQVLLFVTPVIYPISFIDSEVLLKALSFNPMYAPICFVRGGLAGELIFTTEMMISLSSSLLIFFGGLYYFRSTEHYFADIA